MIDYNSNSQYSFQLPPELWFHIFCYLQPKELLQAESVCSQWYHCGSIQTKCLLWRRLCLKKWGIPDEGFHFIGFESWKEAFFQFDVKRVRCIRVALQEISKLQHCNSACLDLSDLTLTAIPSTVFNCLQLRSLYMVNNELKELPPHVSSLTKLEWLSLSNNSMSSLPGEISLLTNLEALYLDDNRFSSFPEQLCSLTKLKRLHFSNNQLTAIPPQISQLTNLQFLFLNNNRLTSIPPQMSSLTSLLSLSINCNQLVCVPAQIVALKLRTLDLSNNPIEIRYNSKQGRYSPRTPTKRCRA